MNLPSPNRPSQKRQKKLYPLSLNKSSCQKHPQSWPVLSLLPIEDNLVLLCSKTHAGKVRLLMKLTVCSPPSIYKKNLYAPRAVKPLRMDTEDGLPGKSYKSRTSVHPSFLLSIRQFTTARYHSRFSANRKDHFIELR